MVEFRTQVQAFLKKELKNSTEVLTLFQQLKTYLNNGELRIAEKTNGFWHTNSWIKELILLSFKASSLRKFTYDNYSYFDKDILPLKAFQQNDNVRIVPLGSCVRDGCYVAPNVIIMPQSYINIGAFIDSGTMVDSHVLIGSCAQIGKNIHLSAGAKIGGVLEPANANPVIIEDNVFIGGNTGIYEGLIISQNAVISTGVILNQSTKIFDAVKNTFLEKNELGQIVIPENAVVIPGTRKLTSDISIACPVIIKYRDQKTFQKINLEKNLRTP